MLYSDATSARNLGTEHVARGCASLSRQHCGSRKSNSSTYDHAWPALTNTDQRALGGNAGVLDVVLAETARDESSVSDSLSPKGFR